MGGGGGGWGGGREEGFGKMGDGWGMGVEGRGEWPRKGVRKMGLGNGVVNGGSRSM